MVQFFGAGPLVYESYVSSKSILSVTNVTHFNRCSLIRYGTVFRGRANDVADRLLILKVDKLSQFVPESDLLMDVLKHRNEIMSEVIYDLQSIVRALKEGKDKDSTASFRMADFANFCLRIGTLWGNEDEVKTVLTKMEYLQNEFHLESDPCSKLLCMWGEENPERELTAAILNSRLAEFAEQKGIDYPYKGNPKSFAQKLRSLRQDFADVLEITDRNTHGGKKKYRICLKWARTKEGGGKGGM